MGNLYEIFIADCKREMHLRKMTNSDLAKATGYKTSTIECFFANTPNREKSTNVAKAISAVLDIEL